MQDEMSRFEAEIAGGEAMVARPVIAAGTYGAMQQQLEQAMIPAGPGPALIPAFNHPMLGQRMMFPPMGPPPPMMIPAQVQRMRLPQEDEFQPGFREFNDGVPAFVRAGLPGPQLLPPPPKPQPIILSAKPQLYKQLDEKEAKKEKTLKRKSSPLPRELTPPRVETPPAPPPPVMQMPEPILYKPKKEKKSRKVVRTAGGQTWEDVTLLEWPDDDFRLFCGDLGNDVTDELLVRTFSKYSSFQRAKVVRDKRTNKSKGFGFVSFKDPGDFIKAMKEMDGRYVGSRPIKLRKSTWKNRSLDVVRKKEKEKAALLSQLMAGNKS